MQTFHEGSYPRRVTLSLLPPFDAHSRTRTQDGYYMLVVTPVVEGSPNVSYTWWWQFCADMNFKDVPIKERPVCGNNAFAACPEGCADAVTGTCGNGCAGMLAQQTAGSPSAFCWSTGEWSGGEDVSVALYNPSNAAAGVIYTIKKGDAAGCTGGARRSLSLAVACPAAGAAGTALFPTNVLDLGNCAYAASMTHPSACPAVIEAAIAWTWGNSFLLALFLGGGCYFGCGALYRYKSLDARGADVIPHLDAWRSLPGLVFDGCTFALATALDAAAAATGGRLGRGGGGGGGGDGRFATHAAAGFQPIG